MKFQPQNYPELLKYTDELDILKYYIPGIELNKFFPSLFRKEKAPSARIYISKNGTIRYNDFRINEGVLGVIALLHNESISKAKDRVLKDFTGTFKGKKGKYISKQKEYLKQAKKATIITPYFREWKQFDYNYWTLNYGIYLSWLQHPKVKVYPIIKANISGKKDDYTLYCDKLAYCYFYHISNNIQRYKLYQPLSKKHKWLSNIIGGSYNDGVVQLWDTLPKDTDNDLLIITSSLKDSGCIYCNTYNVFHPNRGIYSCAPNNEGEYMPDYVVHKLKQRFKRIIVWMDSDEAGITTMKKYNAKYGFEWVYIPLRFGVKDQSDFRKKYGKIAFLELIKTLIHVT
jgi:hypothetical protein